jgi:capsid protein
MALPWLAALKIIPWKDVVEAAPAVVAAAKSLRKPKATKESAAPAEASAPAAHDPDAALAQLRRQLNEHAARIDALQSTLADLAEHNLRLVAAVDLLRRRTRWLLAGTTLALALAFAAAYQLTR